MHAKGKRCLSSVAVPSRTPGPPLPLEDRAPLIDKVFLLLLLLLLRVRRLLCHFVDREVHLEMAALREARKGGKGAGQEGTESESSQREGGFVCCQSTP